MGAEKNDSEWNELKNNWHTLCFKKSKKGEKTRIL